MLIYQLFLLLVSLTSFAACLKRFEILTDDYGHTIGQVSNDWKSDENPNETNNDNADTDDTVEEDEEEDYEADDPITPTTNEVDDNETVDDGNKDDNQTINEEEREEDDTGNDSQDDENDFLSNDSTMMNRSRSINPKTNEDEDQLLLQNQSSNQQLQSFNNNKLQDVQKSLIIKVYRGPTKFIEKKPFASWGYFIKFPNI